MKLWQKVVIALVLGVIFGWMMNASGPFHYDGSEYLTNYLKPVGTIFINLIKMVVVPLIFFSLVLGITSMTDGEAFKRIGMKSVAAYLLTAAFAVLIGFAFGALFEPGKHVDLALLLKSNVAPVLAPQTPVNPIDIVIKLFVDMVPSNALEAMATDHILQVVVLAVFISVTINSMGAGKVKVVKEFCHEAAHIVFAMIQKIMCFAPYGVFALTSWVVSTQGLDVMKALAVLAVCVTCALFTQYLLFGVLIIVFGRMSPIPFYKKIIGVQSLAFSTSSSKATLPTAMRVVNERMGVSESTTAFVLPLGTSINMDGTAIYLGICALFFAQAYHIHLELQQYIMLVLTATLGSIGAAGIPGGSIAMMGMVFTSVGLPLDGIAVILGIDRILDMLRTTVNITGDSVITMLIDKSEGTFNQKIYNDASL